MYTLEQANKAIIVGELHKALAIIKALKDSSPPQELYIKLLTKEASILHELGETEACCQTANELISIYRQFPESVGSHVDYLVFYYYIDSLLFRGNIREGIRAFNNWERDKIRSLLASSISFQAVYYLCEATIFNHIDLNRAEVAIRKSLKLSRNLKDQAIYVLALYRASRIYTHKGHIDQALKMLTESLSNGELIGSRYIKANSLITLGEIFRLKGEFGKALQYYNEALIIYQMSENKFGIANVYNNVGIVFFSKNDFDSARGFFTKSIRFAKDVGFSYIVAESSYYLIRILLFEGNFKDAEKYLEAVKAISHSEQNRFVKFYTLLCEAVYLQAQNRFKTLARAQEKLQYILKKNSVYQEINIHAMLNLHELLIHELRLTNKKEILHELEHLTEQLLKIAESIISRSLLAETYWLKGKLSLLNGKINDSLDYLSKAKDIAIKQDLLNLSQRIENDYKAIRSELVIWQQLLKEDISLTERISRSQVDELIRNMIHRASYELEEVEVDTPIMLIILGNTGIPLYTYSFSAKSLKDDAIFSGFISALNNVLSEFFGTSGTLKRIEHQDYFLLFQNVSEDIGICYVYKGGTFSAKRKLKKFLQLIKERHLKMLSYALKTGKMIEITETEKIKHAVEEIFKNKGNLV